MKVCRPWAQTQKKWGPKGGTEAWGAEGWGLEGWEAQRVGEDPKFRAFFSLSRPHNFFFLSQGGLLVECWWCF